MEFTLQTTPCDWLLTFRIYIWNLPDYQTKTHTVATIKVGTTTPVPLSLSNVEGIPNCRHIFSMKTRAIVVAMTSGTAKNLYKSGHMFDKNKYIASSQFSPKVMAQWRQMSNPTCQIYS